MVEEPVVVGVGGDVGPLVGVGAQVEDLRDAQIGERLGPNSQGAWAALLFEHQLPVVIPQRGEIAVVGTYTEIVTDELPEWNHDSGLLTWLANL